MMVPCTEATTPGADVLALVFHASADCIKLLDLDGRLLLMNLGGASIMELDDPRQLAGLCWLDFWAEGAEREAAQAALEAARQGGVGRCSGYLATAKGTQKWWDSVITPVLDAQGQVMQLLAVSRDVSEQHHLASKLETALRRTNAIIVATSEIVWQTNAVQQNGKISGLAEFSGLSDDCNKRDVWLSLIHAEDRERIDRYSRDSMAAGKEHVCQYRLRHRSGGYRWVEDRAVPLRSDAGKPLEWVGVITDNHDRLTAAQALRDSEERLRLAVQASRVGIWDVDLVTGTRRWSTDLKEMLGLHADTPEDEQLLFSIVHPEDLWLVQEAHRTAFRETASVTFRILRADTKEERWILSSGQPVLDGSSRAVRRLGTFQDITERKLLERQLWTAANKDPLTLVPNRNLFNANLDQAVADARLNGTRVALMVIDLDHFKEVNDTLGHHAGDAVLQATAQRLAASCDASTTIARLGGDEFAVLIPDARPIADLVAHAEALVAALACPIPHDGDALVCPASLGLAIYPDHDSNSGELLKNADLALYAAKRSGRACYAVFDGAMKSAMQKRVTVLHRARDALAHDAIVPFYQPKVPFEGTSHGGFEALLRWHDGQGLRSPAGLAEAFDDPDLAAQIGQRMLDLVVADIVRWRDAGLDVDSIAINVSAAEFSRVDVADRWLRKIAEAQLPSRMLQMEVTESVFLGEGSLAVDTALDALHARGVPIALDDFGTGFASLAHLRRYPVDWLKIDQSFIRDLAYDKGAQAIVSAVIGLAHGIGLRVVAEGVETQLQATMLAREGCDLAQGYLIAKPMAASRVPHFMRTWPGLQSRPEARRSSLLG